MKTLTLRQDLTAMTEFLARYLDRVRPRDGHLAVLTGDLGFFKDGATADPASWEDWQDAIVATTGRKDSVELTESEAFAAMLKHVEDYWVRLSKPQEVSDFLAYAKEAGPGGGEWQRCVEKALAGEFDEWGNFHPGGRTA